MILPISRRFILLALLMLLVASNAAMAQTSKTVFLEELTWTELRDQIRSGKTTIIIPVGGTEQSGPDMVLGKHNVRVKALAEKIAVNLGNALVAPVVAYVPEGSINPPTAHMKFPGTITLPDDSFEKMLTYAARSFKLHGFRDIVFIGDHGGYQSDLNVVADRLNHEWAATPAATPMRAYAIEEYYRVTETEFVQQLKNHGYSNDEIGKHAGLADTSLSLAVDPRLVRIDKLRSGDKLGSSDGVSGAPQKATAELGQLGVDLIVSRTVDAIKKAIGR